MRIDEARALHAETPVVDLHADTAKLMDRLGYDVVARHRPRLPRPLQRAFHFDLPRARDGGLAAQVFGLWTFPYPRRGCAAAVHTQLDALDRAIAAHPDAIRWAPRAEDITRAHRDGVLAALGGIEGGQALEGDLENIAAFARRGVRAVGLVHFSRNELGSPAMGVRARGGGLTDMGREAIGEMNRAGVLVDLAHADRRGTLEAAALSSDPVIVSHTGVRGVYDHWRNIDDDQLRAVARTGGVVGIIFAPRFLGEDGLDAVCDHIFHIIDVAGEDTPALGSDFDGLIQPPRGLVDVAGLPALTAALSSRGASARTLEKILGKNALRALSAVPPRLAERAA